MANKFKIINYIKHTSVLAVLLTMNSMFAIAQKPIDLAALCKSKKLISVQREINLSTEKNGAVSLDAHSGEGLAWLEGNTFSGGSIEVDLKGKDEFQKSFLGIAFHGVNDSTYDAIYFRPFNFRTKDSIRSIHAVQYISHPEFPWKKLRDEKNAQFEKGITPAPDPNDWFHARIKVTNNEVLVYVNHAKEASLKVQNLNTRKTGKIGLWVGDGAGGAFANLIILEHK